MMRAGIALLIAACAAMASAAPATAQSGIRQAAPLSLETGAVPGAQGPEQTMGAPGRMTLRNVVSATLTPVLPDPARATGAAVIVAPGGGLMALAIDQEGFDVARALADRGIAAFVLKYRLDPTPRDGPGYMRFSGQRMNNWVEGKPGTGIRLTVQRYSLADALAALRLVRTRAAEWKIDPARTGMIGFSAGARVTLAALKAAPAGTAPAFVGLFYPPMQRVDLPAYPPAFIAMAGDDPLNRRAGFGILDSWAQAGKPYEVHIFQRGGHGFGLGAPNSANRGWPDLFVRWLETNAMLRGKP